MSAFTETDREAQQAEASPRWMGLLKNIPGWLYGNVRDFVNERRFRQLDGNPMYSGIYPTYEAATLGMPKHGGTGFDDAAAVDFFLHHHEDLNQFDYPVLFWLEKTYRPGDAIFDFGGGLGQCRYAYRPYLPLIEEAPWTVCDVPSLVEKGRELARQRGAAQLHFTTDLKNAAETSIFLTNGALQYLHADLPELLRPLDRLPEHVIVNRIPVYTGEAYYTVQRTRHRSYTPYRIVNRDQFVAAMADLGYQLVDSWEVQRSVYVNFHPERYVPSYGGFYFSRTAGTPLVTERATMKVRA